MSNRIVIKLACGKITATINKKYFYHSPCRYCGDDVYWIKLKRGKKIPVSIRENGYILHNLVCPVLSKKIDKIKFKKKKYEKRKMDRRNS